MLDGVMMRNGTAYGIAVRKANGEIFSNRMRWRTLFHFRWLALPFVRGFPILLETLVNGIQAFNLSARIAESPSMPGRRAWEMGLTIVIAIIMAIGLFVIIPHLLSLLMMAIGWGADAEGLSFHIWDGFYKCAIFILYIWLISFVPEIHRVFEYHGAEHKVIHAWECGIGLDPTRACGMSRLHPRCGTTFFLFVICVSIVLQAFIVPPILRAWSPGAFISRQAYILAIKLALVIPISAVAFELIRFAARLGPGLLANILQMPGLVLQRLTTREPDLAQMEVAMTALAEALGNETFFGTQDDA